MRCLRAALLVIIFIPYGIFRDCEDGKRCREILRMALTEHDPDTRRQADPCAQLAGGREPYITMVQSALTDKDVPVRLAAVSSLAEMRTQLDR